MVSQGLKFEGFYRFCKYSLPWFASRSLINLIILLQSVVSQEIENADESLLEDCSVLAMASNPIASNQKYFLRISHFVSGKQHETRGYLSTLTARALSLANVLGATTRNGSFQEAGLGVYSVIM